MRNGPVRARCQQGPEGPSRDPRTTGFRMGAPRPAPPVTIGPMAHAKIDP